MNAGDLLQIIFHLQAMGRAWGGMGISSAALSLSIFNTWLEHGWIQQVQLERKVGLTKVLMYFKLWITINIRQLKTFLKSQYTTPAYLLLVLENSTYCWYGVYRWTNLQIHTAYNKKLGRAKTAFV